MSNKSPDEDNKRQQKNNGRDPQQTEQITEEKQNYNWQSHTDRRLNVIWPQYRSSVVILSFHLDYYKYTYLRFIGC